MSRLRSLLSVPQAIAAVVLVALIAIVPFQLRDRGSEPDAPAAGTTAAATTGATDTVVSLDATRDGNGAVVGDKKNPFRPTAGAGKAKTAAKDKPSGSSSSKDTDAKPKATSTATPSGGSGTSSGGKTPAAAPTATPTPTATPAPTPAAPTSETVFTAFVRAGAAEGELRARRLARLGSAAPGTLFIGLRPDHKTAVFLVEAGTAVSGDLECSPSLSDCKRMEVRPGGIVLVERGGREHLIELVRVRRSKLPSTRAASARAATAHAGRDALREMLDRVGDLRYDAAAGVVRGDAG